MSQLAQLQADFQAYILDNGKNISFKKQIVNDKKVGATQRLSIYSDGYRLRIIEALGNAYPILHAWLGDAQFESIARSYIEQYPSMYRNMRWVGGQMSQHLSHVLPQHPGASEMATFEWALALAFDAEDVPVITIQDLATIPPETWGELSFELHSSVQLLDLQWNIVAIWKALNAEKTPPVPLEIKEPCLVWRSDLNPYYRSLDMQEYEAIQRITSGASFGALCEHLSILLTDDDATQQAAQYLASWLEAGLISQIKVS